MSSWPHLPPGRGQSIARSVAVIWLVTVSRLTSLDAWPAVLVSVLRYTSQSDAVSDSTSPSLTSATVATTTASRPAPHRPPLCRTPPPNVDTFSSWWNRRHVDEWRSARVDGACALPLTYPATTPSKSTSNECRPTTIAFLSSSRASDDINNRYEFIQK